MLYMMTDEDKSVYINPRVISDIRELRDDAVELILQKQKSKRYIGGNYVCSL